MTATLRGLKIQVACPAHTITGGPEALHQLVHTLRRIGADARIVYNYKDGEGHSSPTATPFRIYDIEVDESIEDDPSVVVIVSEMQTEHLRRYRKVRKAIWWLSIDNYWIAVQRTHARRRWWQFFEPLPFDVDRPGEPVIHLAQSEYARRYLQSKQLDPVLMLTDYLRDDFLAELVRESGPRLPKIAYNPSKGIEVTQRIVERAAGRLEFVRIENMSPDQVREVLLTSAVYMDFGHHPGRDRIPREAAACGCCLLTGRRGSAANDVDIPIPEEFKLDESSPSFVEDAVEALVRLTRDHSSVRPVFDEYRRVIFDQKRRFEEEVESFVEALV